MRETYKSCDAISENILKSSKFSVIRQIVRHSVSESLSKEKPSKNKTGPRVLGHRDRLIHSLVQNWLSKNDYPLAAIAMKAEMEGNLIDNPEAYVSSGSLFENNLKLNSEKNLPPIKTEKELQEGRDLPLIGKAEQDVIKVAKFDKSLEESMKNRVMSETERKQRVIEKNDEVADETSSDETTSARSESDSTSSSEKEEVASWGPSKIALITDNLPDSSEPQKSDNEEKINEKTAPTKNVEKEQIKEDNLEELKYPEDDSVDDLEEFDTGLLSSGGSEFSF